MPRTFSWPGGLWRTTTGECNVFHHPFNWISRCSWQIPCARHGTSILQPLRIGDSKCHCQIPAIHQYEHIAFFSQPEETALGGKGLSPDRQRRQQQPINTLRMSETNALEHCLCGVHLTDESPVFSEPRGDSKRGLNLINSELWRPPFVSCRVFHSLDDLSALGITNMHVNRGWQVGTSSEQLRWIFEEPERGEAFYRHFKSFQGMTVII